MMQRGDGNGAGAIAGATKSRWPVSDRPMGIGVILPIAEDSAFGGTPHFADILAMTRTAEEIGLDAVWIIDHLVFRAQPDSQFQVPADEEDRGVWECFTTMAGLASATERIQIGSLVACTGFRNPGLVAKMTETIDDISGGRVILGLGAGWHEPEYAAFGFPFDHRVSRFAEALQIITALLRTGHVDFQGTYYTARDGELRPRGPRSEGPPILVGGSGQRMLRLAARYADAWNADRQNDVAAVQALNARVDAACHDVGRDPASLSRVIGIQVDLLNTSRQAMQPRQWVMDPWPLTGTPQELATQIRQYAQARVEHMMIWIDPVSVAGIE